MAQKENKSKSGKTNKGRNKGSSDHNMEHHFESGDNPEERTKMGGGK